MFDKRIFPAVVLISVILPTSSIAQTAPGYHAWVDALAKRESGGYVNVTNPLGYRGLFQIGKLGLIEAGFKDRQGNWTALAKQHGVESEAEFLASKTAQVVAAERYWESTANQARARGLVQYVGQQVGGVDVSESGILAGCHLVGCGAVNQLLKSNGTQIPGDANNTKVTEYMTKFGGYETPYNAIIDGTKRTVPKTLHTDWSSSIDFKWKPSPAPQAPPTQVPGPLAQGPIVSPQGSNTTLQGTTRPEPGGISLNRAAADKLALDLDLEAVHFEGGRAVLSGGTGKGMKVDAPLFLTTMRLACEGVDPYFSLDPEDGQVWSDQANQASGEVMKLLRARLNLDGDKWWNSVPHGLRFREFSARRDFAKAWPAIQAKYPNLRTKLVFQPQWLSETRLGEIFYIADVLLKELSMGIPVVRIEDKKLRALQVDGYISARYRSAGESLLANVDGGKMVSYNTVGQRFWFDLVPRSRSHLRSLFDDDPVVMKSYVPTTPTGRRLQSELARYRYADGIQFASPVRNVSLDHNLVDLTHVKPTMFVIGHDNVKRQDVGSNDPYEIAVANDVNRRMDQYIAAYEELRQLTQTFRLYVASVAIVKRSSSGKAMCASLKNQPLLPGERVARPLPQFHPTELAFVIASYRAKNDKGRTTSWWSSSAYSSGGVRPRGQELVARAEVKPTPITQSVALEVAGKEQQASWRGKSGRQYHALLLADPTARGSVVDPPSTPPTPAPLTKQQPPPAKGGGMLDDVEPDKGVVIIRGR